VSFLVASPIIACLDDGVKEYYRRINGTTNSERSFFSGHRAAAHISRCIFRRWFLFHLISQKISSSRFRRVRAHAFTPISSPRSLPSLTRISAPNGCSRDSFGTPVSLKLLGNCTWDISTRTLAHSVVSPLKSRSPPTTSNYRSLSCYYCLNGPSKNDLTNLFIPSVRYSK